MKSVSIQKDSTSGEEIFEVYLRGEQLLNCPLLNKGTAFSEEERRALGVNGLLPPRVSEDIESQCVRAYEMYRTKKEELEKFIFLQGLLNRNETLFYHLVSQHLDEMLPIVYTPTVGGACLAYSHITRDHRGVYLSPENIGDVDQIFRNLTLPDVKLIVVTDGERILGLGDLGSDGMGIPVGKINLYVAGAGLHPAHCLPICLDVGTNTQRLLDDPLYFGRKSKRMAGAEYDAFVEKFVTAVKRNFPNALLQWEDFGKGNAFRLLEKYQDRVLSFNDDIQGTGSVTLAALTTAMRIKKEKFRDQRYVIVGMGQAGTGIASNIVTAMRDEGVSEAEARSKIFAFGSQGLLVEDTPRLAENQKPYAQKRAAVSGWKVENANQINLVEVIRNAKATVLIGVTAKTGLFNAEILAQLAKNTERPIVFALSNPTSKCECTPEEVVKATHGKGFVATGSPFAPVAFEGRTIVSSQCNNMFVFPGAGLGALVAGATKVTDRMFVVAARAVSNMVTEEQCRQNMLLPELKDIRRVSREVAKAVAIEARESGLGKKATDEEFERMIEQAQWQPTYRRYRAAQTR